MASLRASSRPGGSRKVGRTLAIPCAVAASALTVMVGGAAPAAAQAPCPEVRVAEVSGLLDPVLVDFVEHTVTQADECGAVAVVLQLDSPGGVVSDDRLDRLVTTMTDSRVPVTVWVGPSGAQARGAAAEVVAAADVAALAPRSRLAPEGARSYGSEDAVTAGRTDFGGRQAATVGDFIVSLADHGVDVEVLERREGEEVRREPVTRTRFSALSLVDQLAHTVASPPVAYLLFVVGLALLLFELYTAGIGVAGLVGATAVVLAGYGLAVLPASGWAVALLVAAFAAFGVDVQTGVPRVWTGIGGALFVAGSLLIYDGDVSLSWITLLVAFLGIAFATLAGMPAMVRSRFSTPTIGREWMVGEVGTARTSVAPDGTVVVRGAPWRARTNRATPIREGASVRVAAIDGLVLEVEPVDGAARDYRERAAH
jgi:membrane-bound serine protease (ClpP class)